MTTTRVVGYVRISRAHDDSTSIPRQREIITKTAEARGWDLVGIEEDIDVSASKTRLDRPGLHRVRDLLRHGEADAVVVWRLDRLARSVVDFGTLLDEGIEVISCTEPLDTTSSMGRAMAEVIQVFAALESRTISERVRSARDHLARTCRHPGGVAPYGYRSVPHPSGSGRALEIEAEEARLIRRIADHVLAGKSAYSALKIARESGSLPRRARAWSLSSVVAVLTGDAVLGRLRHRGALVRDDDTHLPLAPWEPVLTIGEVERLRALLAPSQQGPGSHTRRRASRLLSGLVQCASCGGRMRVNSTGNGSRRTVRYSCRGDSDGRGCTAPTSITAEALESHVEELYLTVHGRFPVLEHVESVREVADLAETEAALRDVTAAMREPGADINQLAAQAQSLAARRDQLAAAPAETVVETVATGKTFAETYAESDLARRRDLIGYSVEAVVIASGQRGRKGLDTSRVTVRWDADDLAAVA